MSVHNFDRLFHPRSVAFFGASPEPHTVGHVVTRNLLGAGFEGPVWLVNPRHEQVEGVPCHPDAASLPEAPDLAVIATPPATVPGLLAEVAARGTRAAVVLSAGFGKADRAAGAGQGASLRQRLLDAARPHGLRIVGPNGVGLAIPGLGLNASFVHINPLPGQLAFVSQSGAVVTSVVDWATARDIGFSKLVSLGDMADVDFGDMLDYLAADRETRAILLYVEAVTHARKFMSAARVAARSKPVVVVKAGRHAEGARAAASHTGALTGSDEVYGAAFRRAGLLRVYDLDELFDAAQTLATLSPFDGERLAILTNGGGMGVLATDSLIDHGGRLASLSPQTIKALDAVLPATWSKGNPVDIIGDAEPERYAAALEALLGEPEADALLVMNCPAAVASSSEAAQAVVDTLDRKPPRVPVFTAWLGSDAAAGARDLFAERKIPTYDTPTQAVRAFMHMVGYRRGQDMLQQMPPSLPSGFTADPAAARRVIEAVLAEGRDLLSEPEAKRVLAAYGLPVVPTRVARDAEAVRQAAEALLAEAADGRWGAAPPACVVKILSPDISHKSDVGGVRLDLASPKEAALATTEMLAHLRRVRPEARLEGFTVQPMVIKPRAMELILGLSEDRQFGPVVLFGEGGTAVEVIADKALALPPLNLHLARDLMAQTRVYRRLQGYRDRPAADLDGIALALVRLAQMAVDLAQIAELDVNPLLADEQGILALDARIRVVRREDPGAARFAIRPYPAELEEEVALADGMAVFLRPIRPEDERLYPQWLERMDPEDIRLRLFAPVRHLSHHFLARLTQIDYDREMALIALSSRGRQDTELLGVARYASDPDNHRAEFGVIVRSDLKGHGLGWTLMERLIAHARKRGTGEIFGEILRENAAMLHMCRDLGFRIETSPEDPHVMIATLPLTGETPGS
jgi:acetyltransferase